MSGVNSARVRRGMFCIIKEKEQASINCSGNWADLIDWGLSRRVHGCPSAKRGPLGRFDRPSSRVPTPRLGAFCSWPSCWSVNDRRFFFMMPSGGRFCFQKILIVTPIRHALTIRSLRISATSQIRFWPRQPFPLGPTSLALTVRVSGGPALDSARRPLPPHIAAKRDSRQRVIVPVIEDCVSRATFCGAGQGERNQIVHIIACESRRLGIAPA